jgi:hypothetical protein
VPITSTWTTPSSLDRAIGDLLTESIWDNLVSNELYLWDTLHNRVREATILQIGVGASGDADAINVIHARTDQNTSTFLTCRNDNTGASSLAGFQALSATALLLASASAGYGAPYTSKGLLQSNAAAGLMLQNTNSGPIQFYVGAGTTLAYSFSSAGHLLAGTDNTYDIGAAGATRPRSVYAGTAVAVGATPATAGELRVPSGGSLRARNLANNNNGILIGSAGAGTDTILVGTSGVTGDIAFSMGSTGIVSFWSNGGVTVGTPTGGDKGVGTLNATACYDDNVLLTDYVFEPGYDLLPLADMRAFYAEHLHLPTIPGRATWEETGSFPLGKIATHLWETVEVQAIYIAQLHDRVAALEART